MSAAPPLTGPEAIEYALQNLDLNKVGEEARQVIRDRKKTARPRAVRILHILQGLERNKIEPKDLMVRRVPVIPPRFRPFSITGDTFLPGDANELYRDLVEYRRLYKETEGALGRAGAGDVYDDLNTAVKAVYGYGESPNPKTRSRGVKGFFETAVGTNPKTSFYQSKMLSKPLDTVGRAVIVPDPELGMDEVAVPWEQGWKMYSPYIQRRLVRGGMSPVAAIKAVKERTTQAQQALEAEAKERPVYVTRSPAWHKFNVVGARPKFVDGHALRINTFITDGLTADFDGDAMSIHVPSTKEAVEDINERLMASKMLFSIKNRDSPMGIPKHEQILGLSTANKPTGKVHRFSTNEEAMQQIRLGNVGLGDEVEIGETQPGKVENAGAGRG